eukprot:6213528-Pleurochrysis_carterae.AAC.1
MRQKRNGHLEAVVMGRLKLRPPDKRQGWVHWVPGAASPSHEATSSAGWRSRHGARKFRVCKVRE